MDYGWNTLSLQMYTRTKLNTRQYIYTYTAKWKISSAVIIARLK